MNKTATAFFSTFAALFALTLPSAAAVPGADSAPFLLDTMPSPRIATEGEAEPLAYSPRWGGAASCSISADGARVLSGATADGTLPWTPRGTGRHALAFEAGATRYAAAFTVLGDDVALHGGVLSAGETWAAGKTHLVTAPLTVPSGVTLTIEAGAVVKFMDGASLTVASGGACIARGVVFTHVADDTAGGDTMMDGDGGDGSPGTARPTMGAYTITGTVTDDDATEYRYMPPQTLTSSITSDTRLRGHRCYIVSNSVTVASGATLTLQPGTVLKFNTGCQMTVNGTLSAIGTRAAPIVFTSLKDDAHGGDTNGDGEKTYAQPGDWYQIRVAGTANFNYCSILYNSSTENYGGLEAYGGTVTLDNSEIAHCQYECVNAHSSGTLTARNTAFWDGSLGFGYYGSGRVKAYNCVFQGLTTAIRQSGKQLVNCIFSDCRSFTDQGGDGSTFDHCVFWNPSGFGAQSYSKTGSSGNIWGDPLFLDPDNGDFRIASASSPCVDAADSSAAPATDYYGQPRMDVRRVKDTGVPDANGVCADIGLYEVPGDAAVPLPDLAVVAVNALAARSTSRTGCQPVGNGASNALAARSTVGDEISVTYVVTNRGAAAATGLVRDAFRLVGADGATAGLSADAGEVVQTYSLQPGGAAAEMTATLAVPAAKPGVWKLGVEINPQRDIFEQNLANNGAWAEDTVDIAIDALPVGSHSIEVQSGETAGYVLSDLPLSGGAVRVMGATAALAAYGGNGAMPTGGSVACATIPLDDGSLLVVFPARAEGEDAYLALENGAGAPATVSVEVQAPGLALYGAAPARVANTGEAAITVSGCGIGAATAVMLGGRAAKDVVALNAAQIVATFDVDGMAAGSVALAATAADATSATLPNAVEIYAAKTGPKLEAWLDTPGTVRDGRVFTAWVRYRNSGDSAMPMPLFKVSRTDSSTKLGLEQGVLPSEDALYVGGISPTAPAGVLGPGEEGSVAFFFRPFGTYGLSLSHVGDAEAAAYPDFGGVGGFRTAVSAAATRLALRGRAVTDLHDLSNFALLSKAGAPVAAISGVATDFPGRAPLSGAIVRAISNDTGATVSESETDSVGRFSLEGLADGVYRVLISGAVSLVAPTGTVEIAAGADVNGVLIVADAGGAIRGVAVPATGTSAEGVSVRLLDEVGTPCAETQTDVSGAFAFTGIANGTYSVIASASGTHGGAIVEDVRIDDVAREVTVELSLPAAGEVRGTVVADGVPVSGGKVQVVRPDGANIETSCAEDGTYRLQGVPAGSWNLRYHALTLLSDDVSVDVTEGVSTVVDLSARPRPLFEPFPAHGYGSLEAKFLFLDSRRAEEVTSWAWDLDGDGVTDSVEASPTFTYMQPGAYSMELRFTEGGTNITVRSENCVLVDDAVPTVYREGAIVSGHNAGTLEVVSVLDASLLLRGTPDIPLAPGGALLLEDATGEWVLRKIVSVSGDAASGWVVETEDGTLRDIYRRFAYSGLVEVPDIKAEEPVRSASGRQVSRSRKASSGDSPLKGFAEGGVYGSVTIQPNLHFVLDIDIDEDTGTDYTRKFGLVGSVTLGLTGGFRGALGANLEIPVHIPTPPIPTPVPGCTLEVLAGTKLIVRATGEGSGEWNGGVDVGVQIGMERGNDGKYHWMPPLEFAPFGSSSADFSGKVEVAVEEQLGLKARLAGAVSIVLSNVNGVRFEAKAATTSPPSLELYADAGIHAEANLVDIDLPFWNFRLGADFDAKKKISIGYWEGPTPDFSFSQSGEGGASVSFTDESDGGYWKWLGGPKMSYPVRGWEWNFGGIGSSGAKNPSFTFPGKGKYKVSLRALGSSVSGPNRKRKTVAVGNPDDVPEDEDAPYASPDDLKQGTSKQSCDPNEMDGPEGVGDERLLVPGEWATYTIYFENQTNATADAQEVIVDTALSPQLDWSTFEMLEVAFGNHVDTGLAGRKNGTSSVDFGDAGLTVKTTVALNEQVGSVLWTMRIWDPNGMFGWPNDGSGFLPPNDPETHCGEGHITYRVKVREDATPGARIDASATIVFDYNDPIPTDPAWWNTVGTPDEPLPVFRFYSKAYKGHFFTIDEAEKDNLIANNPNWKFEGTAYRAYTNEAAGTVPLYRFYSKGYRGHFFTIDADEAETVKTNPNWKYEGIAYYVYPDKVEGSVPVFRFWSKGYRHHFYTIDEEEAETIRKTNKNWSFEGTAFYALPAEEARSATKGRGIDTIDGNDKIAINAINATSATSAVSATSTINAINGDANGFSSSICASPEVGGGVVPWVLATWPDCEPVAPEGVTAVGGLVVETRADAPELEDLPGGDGSTSRPLALPLLLALPDGAWRATLRSAIDGLVSDEEAAGVLGLALPANGVWHWLRVRDAAGDVDAADAFSLWLRAE